MDLWVRIQDITENKLLRYEGSLPLVLLEELLMLVGEQTKDAHYNVCLSRSGRFLLLKGTVEGVLIFDCDRCLEPFEYPQQEQFRVTLLPAESQKGFSGDQNLSNDELEIGVYQGEWLDLQKIMEEQIVLGIPMKKICSEDCKGICPQCGNNLNLQTCACPLLDNSDHPFASLSQ